MREHYTHSLIDSTKKYLNNLYYLGHTESIKDINKYKILHFLYKWAVWANADSKKIKKLERLMNAIVFSNSNIILPKIIPQTRNYSNVNTWQTDYTWQKIIGDYVNPGIESLGFELSIRDNLELPVGGSLNSSINGSMSTRDVIVPTDEVSYWNNFFDLPEKNAFKSVEIVTDNCEIYFGLLYPYYAANDPLLPSSEEWYLPSGADYIDLCNTFEFPEVELPLEEQIPPEIAGFGFDMKVFSGVRGLLDTEIPYWEGPIGTNTTGFRARGTGMSFLGMGEGRGIIGTFQISDGWYLDDLPEGGLSGMWDEEFKDFKYTGMVVMGSDMKSLGIGGGGDDDVLATMCGVLIMPMMPPIINGAVRFIRKATTAELNLKNGTPCEQYLGNDGKSYDTVKIGDKVWLSENLAETKYRNNVEIPSMSNLLGNKDDEDDVITEDMLKYYAIYTEEPDPNGMDNWEDVFSDDTIFNVTLYGGKDIILREGLCSDWEELLGVTDNEGIVLGCEAGVFNYCHSIRKPIKFDNATFIGDYCFYKCMGIPSFQLDNMITAGDYAFYETAWSIEREFPNAISFGDFCHAGQYDNYLMKMTAPKLKQVGIGCYSNASMLMYLYTPLCDNFGDPSLDNYIFGGVGGFLQSWDTNYELSIEQLLQEAKNYGRTATYNPETGRIELDKGLPEIYLSKDLLTANSGEIDESLKGLLNGNFFWVNNSYYPNYPPVTDWENLPSPAPRSLIVGSAVSLYTEDGKYEIPIPFHPFYK